MVETFASKDRSAADSAESFSYGKTSDGKGMFLSFALHMTFCNAMSNKETRSICMNIPSLIYPNALSLN